RVKGSSKDKDLSESNDPYLKDLPSEKRFQLLGATIVGIDPGKIDLLFCVSEYSTAEKPELLRYSQNRRNLDCKKRRYQQIRQELQGKVRIDGKSIKELETELGQVTKGGHKTMSIPGYNDYLRAKLLFNHQLRNHYQEPIYRKLRLNTFINTKKSEAQ